MGAPSGAGAATTIGSDLATAPASGACAAQSCTVANSTLPARELTSPFNGVIVEWRVRISAVILGTQIAFKVIRNAGGGAYTGISTSLPETIAPTADTVLTFGAQQPIAAGDQIGLDSISGQPGVVTGDNAGVTFLRWQPPLADSATLAPVEFEPPDLEVLVNADVEPDCDSDGLGDETQDADTSSCTAPGPAPLAAAPPACKGKPATIIGTEGNDVLKGASRKDVMVGMGGNDKLSGLAGNDLICGGRGKDTLNGGKGKDKLYGQSGKDKLKGGKGKDVCKGGKGKDTASKCEVEKSI